jgi:hypothetical protein
MRKNRVVEQNRCYHLVSRLAHRAFFLDDEEKAMFKCGGCQKTSRRIVV